MGNEFVIYENVFKEDINNAIFASVIRKHEKFVNSQTSAISPIYSDWRKSKIIYHNNFPNINLFVKNEIMKKLDEVRNILSIEKFELDKIEVQLTTHNHGDYYKWHTDNGTKDTFNRVITFVYYFNAVPKVFSGGELILYPKKINPIIIIPDNNNLIFFNSSIKHEVKSVVCPTRLFEDGRFTINGWVRKKI